MTRSRPGCPGQRSPRPRCAPAGRRLNASRSPMTRSRMSFSCSLRTCCSRAVMNSPMSRPTSSCGPAPVLAAEGEQGEHPTPCSTHAAHDALDRLGRRPGGRRSAGSRRRLAQRPLPSMMMATCRGVLSRSAQGFNVQGSCCRLPRVEARPERATASRGELRSPSAPASFSFSISSTFGDELVGDLLDLVLGPVLRRPWPGARP